MSLAKRLLGALTCASAVACGAPPAPAAPAVSARTTPLAAVLGASLCDALAGRVFALPSGADGVTDTFVLVKRCRASAARDELGVVVDAYAWLAVDRDFGAIAVHGFVHATLHGDVRARVHAHARGDALEVTLAPLPGAAIAFEPVGALELTPQNWASFFAIELAPAAGASPEALAKKRLREEAERTLADALAKPFAFTYDAREGALAGARATRLRIVPHGTALEGPMPEASASSTVRVRATAKVAVRALCASHAEHVLDADRRGESVALDDWSLVEGEATLTLASPPCPWLLAVRAATEAPAIVDVDLARARAAATPSLARDRWISVDAFGLDAPLDDDLLSISVATDVWHRTLGARAKSPEELPLPAIVVLAPDQELRVRLLRRDREQTLVEAEERVPLADDGAFERTLVLATKDGRSRATVHLRARVRREDP